VWQLFEELRDKLAAKYQELQQKKQQVSGRLAGTACIHLHTTALYKALASTALELQQKKQQVSSTWCLQEQCQLQALLCKR
jgi:hypothetical protein